MLPDIQPGNTKILYFFNCLLDGMHTTVLFSGVCLSNELNSNPPYICSGHSIPNKSNADLITFIVTSTTFNLASFTFSSSTLIWQS